MKTLVRMICFMLNVEAHMNQETTPYVDALNTFADRDLVRVIVPGHSAQEGGVPTKLDQFIAHRPFGKDVTPLLTGIDKGVDNPLDLAKQLAAEAWSAKRVWFLTNGASQGNRVAALSLAGLGDHVVAQRSAHSSFVDGLILSGLSPRFVMPSLDEQRGIAHGITADRLDDTIRLASAGQGRVGGVYVVSPSYFGAVADIRALVDVAHSHNLPLIVDAAWGAHFGFSPLVPENPIKLGADLVISSTHKLGGSLTQSAMIHLADTVYGARLEPLVDRAFGLTQSTSENSWLLASLDVARHALANGAADIERSVQAADALRAHVRTSVWLELVEDSFREFPDIIASDPLHVPIDISRTGVSGHDIKEVCANDLGLYFEASTQQAVIALIGAGSSPDGERIVSSIERAAEIVRARGGHTAVTRLQLPQPGKAVLSPREAFLGGTEIVSAADAVGRISADTLAAYPPGIPNVLPGEQITQATVEFIRAVAASSGGFIRGAVNRRSDGFRVVKPRPTHRHSKESEE